MRNRHLVLYIINLLSEYIKRDQGRSSPAGGTHDAYRPMKRGVQHPQIVPSLFLSCVRLILHGAVSIQPFLLDRHPTDPRY